MYHKTSLRFALCVVLIQIALVIAGCGPPDVEKLREEQDVEKLVNILEDTDQEISLRVEAANALAEIGGGEAVDSLAIVFYETESRQLKESCLEGLVRIGDQDAASRLLEGVWTKPLSTEDLRLYDEESRELAMEGLVKIGDETMREIETVYMSRSFSEERLETIITLLSRIGGQDAVRLVSQFAADESYERRKAAIDAIASMVKEDPKTADYLIPLLSSDDPSIRQGAAAGLGLSRSESAVRALTTAVREDDNADVRRRAALSLAHRENTECVDALIAALEDEEDTEVAGRIVFALGQIGSDEAVEGLITALGDAFDLDHGLYPEVSVALEKNGEQAVDPLLDFVLNEKGKYPRVAGHTIADTLVEIGDASIVPPLIEGLGDPSKEELVRSRIAYVLGEMGDEEAIPALVSALKDGVSRAGHALRKLHDNDPEKLVPLLEEEETVAIYGALISIGESGTEEALIRALNQHGYKRMAEDYLNSGNPDLEEAAEAWAEAHGYSVTRSPAGGGGPAWGEQ